MARRRSVRSVKVLNNNNYNNLTLNDVLCPICRNIFIEPVTLPCSHGFCFPCFDGTLANANLTCPLCRVRFGSWHRLAKKEQKIINEQFWDAIKVTFPKEVKNRLNGIDEQLEEPAPIRLTSPGSIRRDYELQKAKDEEQLAKQREAELKASEDLIRKLKEEEKRETAERLEKLKLDERIAKEIAKEIGYVKATNSKTVMPKHKRSLDKFVNEDKKQCMFVYKIQNKTKLNHVICQDSKHVVNDNKTKLNGFINATNAKDELIVKACDKNDCINIDLMHFKPIEQINVPLKKVVSPIKVPAKVNKLATVIIGPPSGNILFAHNSLVSAFATFITEEPSKIKSLIKKRKLYNQNEESTSSKLTKMSNCYTPLKKSIKNNKAKLEMENNSSTSPPFHGFDNNKSSKDNMSTVTKLSVKSNKKAQEESDLEFARQLHEELNKNSRYYTRNSITQRNTLKKRQITLDQFMNSPKTSIM